MEQVIVGILGAVAALGLFNWLKKNKTNAENEKILDKVDKTEDKIDQILDKVVVDEAVTEEKVKTIEKEQSKTVSVDDVIDFFNKRK